MPQTSTATAATEQASRYLQQLCKHWSHKAEVTFSPEAGDIRFPNGIHLTLTGAPASLDMSLSVPDDADLGQFQDVVDRHILRFAFREDLNIVWTAT